MDSRVHSGPECSGTYFVLARKLEVDNICKGVENQECKPKSIYILSTPTALPLRFIGLLWVNKKFNNDASNHNSVRLKLEEKEYFKKGNKNSYLASYPQYNNMLWLGKY